MNAHRMSLGERSVQQSHFLTDLVSITWLQSVARFYYSISPILTLLLQAWCNIKVSEAKSEHLTLVRSIYHRFLRPRTVHNQV